MVETTLPASAGGEDDSKGVRSLDAPPIPDNGSAPRTEPEPAVQPKSVAEAGSPGEPQPLGQTQPAVDPGVPVEPESPQRAAPRVRWLGYVIPISIVFIACFAVFVSYRAEHHAIDAAESDQGAIAATITSQRLYSDSVLDAESAQNGYEQWWTLGQAGLNVANPWCVTTPSIASQPASAQISISCELAQTLQSNDLPGYGRNGTFNVTKFAQDDQDAGSFFVDTDSRDALSASQSDRSVELRILFLGVALSLALGLSTIAQQAYRRQWVPARPYFPLYLALPAWAVSVACAVFVLMVWRA